MKHKTNLLTVSFVAGFAGLPIQAALADNGSSTTPVEEPAPTPNSDGVSTSINQFFADWFARSDAAKANQPHWMAPLVTVTPLLQQEIRYDQYWESAQNGSGTESFDSGKGLELIPDQTNEILINAPAWFDRTGNHPAQGWDDWQFLVIKQRLLSANEQSGNYVLSAFVGVQAPFGAPAFTNHAWVVTPTIAGGKGWGDFDVQSTLSAAVPLNFGDIIGTALSFNTTFQYHLGQLFWPEFETNLTHWFGGERAGQTQLFLTPGIIMGRIPIYKRAALVLGVGYQFAVTPKLVTEPALTPIYNHAWIVTARMPF
jgi:hypothetical protein